MRMERESRTKDPNEGRRGGGYASKYPIRVPPLLLVAPTAIHIVNNSTPHSYRLLFDQDAKRSEIIQKTPYPLNLLSLSQIYEYHAHRQPYTIDALASRFMLVM